MRHFCGARRRGALAALPTCGIAFAFGPLTQAGARQPVPGSAVHKPMERTT